VVDDDIEAQPSRQGCGNVVGAYGLH